MSALDPLPLYWRICLINGAVFLAGTLALALSPATVSARVLVSEAVVLALGLSAILVTNALLIRSVLAPLDRLRAAMPGIDLLLPGQRLPVEGQGPVAALITSFNAMLSRLEAERMASTRQALEAQEAERQRIGRELHDEVGQTLTVVLLGVKRAQDAAPPDLRGELTSILESTRAGLEEVRRIAGRLRPGLLADLGLLSALSALATEFTAHTGVGVRRGFAPGLPKLSAEVELVIYRVTQEALTNVARHAHADAVDLSLTRQGEAVALRVADNGVGLRDTAAAASGLQGMRERAAMVSGQLSIGPRVGGGTEVRLLVPSCGAGEAPGS